MRSEIATGMGDGVAGGCTARPFVSWNATAQVTRPRRHAHGNFPDSLGKSIDLTQQPGQYLIGTAFDHDMPFRRALNHRLAL